MGEDCGENCGENCGERLGEKLGENELAVVKEISKDPKTTISELSQVVELALLQLKTILQN